jgi:hypothetical protein
LQVWASEIGAERSKHLLGESPIEGGPAVFQSTFLEPGKAYEIIGRPVGLAGQRQSLATARRSRIEFGGHTVRPAAPGGLSVTAQGDRVSYGVTGGASAGRLQVRRGRGWILADPVVTLSPDSQSAPPSQDFLLLPTNAAGIGEPMLRGRYVYGRGVVSAEATTQPAIASLVDLAASTIAVSVEDEGWETGAAALSNLETATVDGNSVLQFPAAFTGAGTAIYTSRVFDTGGDDLQHLSVVVEAEQQHPLAFESLPPMYRRRRGSNWDWVEGPLDPTDPYYRTIGRTLEVRLSSTDDPTGSSWRPYRPGAYQFRSFQVRLTLERPTGFSGNEFQVEVSRLAVQSNPRPRPVRISGGTF